MLLVMDTRFLESFIAVVEDGSIAGASRRLNLTPGAVKKRLKALEREFGMRLVVDVGGPSGPTHAGMIILEQARAWSAMSLLFVSLFPKTA